MYESLMSIQTMLPKMLCKTPVCLKINIFFFIMLNECKLLWASRAAQALDARLTNHVIAPSVNLVSVTERTNELTCSQITSNINLLIQWNERVNLLIQLNEPNLPQHNITQKFEKRRKESNWSE